MSRELMLVLRAHIARAPIAQLLLQQKLEGHIDVSQDQYKEMVRRLLAERTRLLELIDHAVETGRPLSVTEIANV